MKKTYVRAARIREARNKARLSQAQLSELLGVNQSTVSRWENGTLSCPPSRWEPLAWVLDIPVAWLLSDEPLPTIHRLPVSRGS